MWQTCFPNAEKETLYQRCCSHYNSNIYNMFILYLMVPIIYLSIKGIVINDEVADIVKKSICIILLFYFLIRMLSKILKNNVVSPREEDQMSTAETDCSFDEKEKAISFKRKEKTIDFDIFGLKFMDQIFFCLSIIFLYVMQVWIVNSNFFPKYTSNYSFYSGSSIESLRSFLYSSRVKWQYMMSTSLFLNFLLLINFIRLNENNEVTYFQIIFPFIISNTLPFFFYLQEKNFRQIFEENHNNQIKLKYYENLIRYVLPCQLIVISQEKIIFSNEESKNFNKCKTERELLNKIKSDYKLCEEAYEDNLLNHIQKIKDLSSNNFCTFQARRLDPKTNENFYFEVKVQKINWQTKDSILILLHDRTPIKNLEKMKEINAYKDQLLANVSHDLRTPLHGIMSILEMSLERIYDHFLKNDLNIALKSSQLLLFMINDILDFSQINKGKLGLAFCKTKLHCIVDDVFNIVKFQAEKKGLRLICNFPEKMRNFILHTDPRRLQQILLNLLSNAIKFTIKGEIILSISVIHKMNINFCVSDTGIGISDASQTKLFNLYSKLKNDNLNREGIGLGLVICKHLLDRLCQSEIKVRSKVGVGSTFEFEVPFEVEKEKEEFEVENDNINEENIMGEFQNRRMEIYEWGRRKKKELNVLIVEDDQTSLFVMCK